MVSFPPFRLDEADERLWKGTKLVALRRKPFAILRYLVAHPKRLVTHDELLREVWGGAVVSESAVRSHLHELRQVLGSGVIETVIGRGYRFIAELTVHAKGDHILHGIGNTASWSTSLTAAVQKVLQQAEKMKGKWEARKRGSAGPRAEARPRTVRAARG